jgi:hypothetical protein
MNEQLHIILSNASNQARSQEETIAQLRADLSGARGRAEATDVVERVLQELDYEHHRAERWRAEAGRKEKARRNLERQLAESPFAPADAALAELQGELDRAKAAIPCAACGGIGGEVREVPDAWGMWLCVDSKACNARAASGGGGMIAHQAREMDALRKMLDDRETQLANQDRTIDALTATNVKLVAEAEQHLAELQRRPAGRVVRNLTVENAQLRQANRPLTAAAWTVVRAAQAWREGNSTLTVFGRLRGLLAALDAFDAEEANAADLAGEPTL